MKYTVVAAILIGLMPPGSAQGQQNRPGILAGIDIGRTTVNLETGPGFDDAGNNKLKSLSASLSLGYQWRSGVIVEARLRTTTSPIIGFFGIETEELSESQFLLGYRHFVSDRLAFVPMIGYTDWEIDEVNTGLFSSSGPSRVERESGNGTVIRLGLERHAGSGQAAFTLYTSYSDNKENTAFDTSLGFKFYF